MTPANPTLLIGLGAFGRKVTSMVVPTTPPAPEDPLADLRLAKPVGAEHDALDTELAEAERDPHTDDDPAARAMEVIAPPDSELDGDPGDIIRTLTEEAEACARRLLDLAHFVDTTAPTDRRGPRLDIFIIAELGTDTIAQLVPLLVESLASQLRSTFRPILGAGEGALAVCPVLAAPRRGEPEIMADAITRLAALARHRERSHRPQARIYVVEDQSGKYLLSTGELARSFAAFLSLLLMSQLRDERGVRALVETEDTDRVGPLATFACATLEVDMVALRELCAIRLALNVLEAFDPGALPLSEIASEAHPLVPDRTGLEAQLWQEGSDRSLEEYLEPPHIAVPDIGWTDNPEDITERKMGSLWRLETERVISGFVDEVERFKMDRLAEQIERNGTALARNIASEITDRVHTEIAAGPRGPGRALELARYAATRARGLMDEAKARIDAPNLRSFPPSPLDDGIAEVERAAHAWPRRKPFRMMFLGALCILCATFAIAGLTHLILDNLLAMSGRSIPWWGSALIGAAIAGPMIGYSLWRHLKRHYNWLCQARDDLDQSLVRYLRSDIVDYFRRRLGYTRLLWVYRIYRRVSDQLDRVVAQLESARAALAEARRSLGARERELHETHGAGSAHAGGILYRTILRPDTVRAFYDHIKPPEMGSVASRYHEEACADLEQDGGRASPRNATQSSPVYQAPYADPERVMAFSRHELGHLDEVSPYQEADSPLFRAVSDGVEDYFARLALKLSPPLEIIAAAAGDAAGASHIVIAPPQARALIEGILAAANLDRGWDIRSVSGDARRIHLLLERGQLPVQAVAIASRPHTSGKDTLVTSPRERS